MRLRDFDHRLQRNCKTDRNKQPSTYSSMKGITVVFWLPTFPTMCLLLWDELSIRLMDALMESTRTSIRNRISDNFLLSCTLFHRFHLKPPNAICANSSRFSWHPANRCCQGNYWCQGGSKTHIISIYFL